MRKYLTTHNVIVVAALLAVAVAYHFGYAPLHGAESLAVIGIGQMTPAQARVVDPILSTVAQGYQNNEFVGSALFPTVPVTQRGGKIITFGKEAFAIYDSQRAPGANTKRIQVGYSGDPYALIDYSLEGLVPDELQQEGNAVPGINTASIAVRTVQDSEGLKLEKAQADLATTAGNYASSNKLTTLASTTLWSDLTNSTPIANVEVGKEAVRALIGKRPNTLIMGPLVFTALKQHASIIDRIKYTGRDVPTVELLASLFGVKRVLVGDAIYVDASGAFVDVWGKCAVLAYTELGGVADRGRPSYGYTYRLQNYPIVETPYQDRSAKSWVYPVTDSRAPVIASSIAGYLISPAVA